MTIALLSPHRTLFRGDDLRVACIIVKENCADSTSLCRPDASGPVARQSQDDWGLNRMHELLEGGTYAIKPL